MTTETTAKLPSRLGPLLILIGSAAVASLASLLFWLPQAFGVEPTAGGQLPAEVFKWGFASAAAATGISALSAGYAVATVGSAAVGALTERPELLGRVLILVGLAEGIAIYGLIVSILILNQLA